MPGKLILDFQVPRPQYDPQTVATIVREICSQINGLSEGRIAASYQASSAIPSGSAVSFAKGDFIADSGSTVLGAPGAQYVRLGWKCTVSGSPGTLVEVRALTGT